MDTLLISLGLLLVATALSLMVFSPRTWVVAFAHGLGIQGIIGAFCSAVQIGFIVENMGSRPIFERIRLAVEGMPFHAAGWTANIAYFNTMQGAKGPPGSHLDQYLPIAAIQMAVVAGFIGWRKMREHDTTDALLILVVLLLIGNSGANIMYAWWP